jgi:hypothetical protein
MQSDLSKITHPFIYEINTWPWLEAISKNQRQLLILAQFLIAIGMN